MSKASAATDGIPAVYLHGGPGSGCQPDHRRLFDPERFHAILFDQRGAGRSRPKGRREDNTLPHLIADMEKIREQFGFERWMIVGGSWGATLALAYAQAHPERVSGIVLRATFLGTASRTRGRLPRRAAALLSRSQRGFPRACCRRMNARGRSMPITAAFSIPIPQVHGPAARAWHDTERILSEHAPGRVRLDLAALNSSRPLPATPFMEAHYFQNDCFMKPGQLLAEAARLAGIPGLIVQGRYDLLCPPATSHALAAVWPDSKVRLVEGAGHSLYDPGVRDAVMRAIADLASEISRVRTARNMPLAGKGMLLTSMDIDPKHEADFNRWYDREHLDRARGDRRLPGSTALRRPSGQPEISLPVFDRDLRGARQPGLSHRADESHRMVEDEPGALREHDPHHRAHHRQPRTGPRCRARHHPPSSRRRKPRPIARDACASGSIPKNSTASSRCI